MTTVCCYCDRILDVKRLTPHKILMHQIHEKPEYKELDNITNNNKYYYFPIFFYDDGYVNIPYDENINIMIIDALINNKTQIEIEFKSMDGHKNHLINLQTMEIIDLDKNACCCFYKESLLKERNYELVVQFNTRVIYRNILFNNVSDKIFPLRTEFFNNVLSRLPNKN